MGSCKSKDSTATLNSHSRKRNSNKIECKSQPQIIEEISPPPKNKTLEINYEKIPNKIHKIASDRLDDNNIDQVSGLCGLVNLGNTCFINSAVQCLANTQPLTDYFLSQLHKQELNVNNVLGSKGRITLGFANIIEKIWNKNEQCIRPNQFLKTIAEFNTMFGDGSQQDAQEFLIFLLDMLHEDLNRVKKKPYIEDKDYNGSDYNSYAIESWKNYLMRNKSVIVDLFQGQTKSTLKCLVCNNVSHKFEPFMYLSIPVKDDSITNNKNSNKKITLLDCIKEFTKEEKLEKGELWFCSKCKKHQESTKKIDLWELPNILVVHLKRFMFTRNKRCKLRSFIQFSLNNFDLSQLCAVQQKTTPVYDLYAISNHNGTLAGGHYTTFAKNCANQNWYYFNDTNVDMVQNPEQQIVTPEAYVLFYSKTSVEEFMRQTLSAPESWPHINIVPMSESSNNNTSTSKPIKRQITYTNHRHSVLNGYQKDAKQNFIPQITLSKNKSIVNTSNNNIMSNNSGMMFPSLDASDIQQNGILDESITDNSQIYTKNGKTSVNRKKQLKPSIIVITKQSSNTQIQPQQSKQNIGFSQNDQDNPTHLPPINMSTTSLDINNDDNNQHSRNKKQTLDSIQSEETDNSKNGLQLQQQQQLQSTQKSQNKNLQKRKQNANPTNNSISNQQNY